MRVSMGLKTVRVKIDCNFLFVQCEMAMSKTVKNITLYLTILCSFFALTSIECLLADSL